MGVVVVISNVNFSSFSLPFFFVGPVPMPLVLCVGIVLVCAWLGPNSFWVTCTRA